MTFLDKNRNVIPLCRLPIVSYFLNITLYYNNKHILSSYTLPTLSQIRITKFYSREDVLHQVPPVQKLHPWNTNCQRQWRDTIPELATKQFQNGNSID